MYAFKVTPLLYIFKASPADTSWLSRWGFLLGRFPLKSSLLRYELHKVKLALFRHTIPWVLTNVYSYATVITSVHRIFPTWEDFIIQRTLHTGSWSEESLLRWWGIPRPGIVPRRERTSSPLNAGFPACALGVLWLRAGSGLHWIFPASFWLVLERGEGWSLKGALSYVLDWAAHPGWDWEPMNWELLRHSPLVHEVPR